jgi:hypothetical protein
VWCSLSREARNRFEVDALKHAFTDDEDAATWSRRDPATRSRIPATAVALNANEPPGVDGDDAPGLDGYALDAAFPGSP